MADSKMPEKKRKLADLAKVGNMGNQKKIDFCTLRDTNKEPNAPPSPYHVPTPDELTPDESKGPLKCRHTVFVSIHPSVTLFLRSN